MNLNFFTAKFPFIGGEAIIENELPVTSQTFARIKIFPHVFSKQTNVRKIESNCTVNQIDNYNDLKLSFSYIKLIFYFFFVELFKSKNIKFYCLDFKKWLSLLKQAAKKSKYIEENNLLLPNSINYTYWMNDWALVLVFLKKRKVINNFVFRCGGFDIWDERHEGNYLPFRYIIYKYADKGFPNAKVAEKYMKAKTPYGTKIKVSYLGTNDFGINILNDSQSFKIVSVSSVIALKRVDLIVEILKNISIPIKWVHFGGGDEFEKVKELAEKNLGHHQIEFKGEVANSEIINFYKRQSVNLFITTSSTESLPVSIQEAISFGIPVLATNVGGVSEIVNSQTGILIDVDFDSKVISNLLEKQINSNYFNVQLRRSAREFWENNFNSKNVYKKFGLELQELFKTCY